ncbi:hypothetical protein HDU85_002121 [Gaertneriomyces sp. JEL0708]|nr:hypothetical protein HDU85_002121 [Gaertneriomyces sp. JEL0708]
MATVLYDDLAFPSELYDRYGSTYSLSETFRELVQFAPRIIQEHLDAKKPKDEKKAPDSNREGDGIWKRAMVESVGKVAVEAMKVFLTSSVETEMRRERERERERERVRREDEDKRQKNEKESAQERSKASTSASSPSGVGQQSERERTSPEGADMADPVHKADNEDKAETGMNKATEVGPTSSQLIVSRTVITSTFSALSIYTAYHASKQHGHSQFLTSFRSLLSQCRSSLTSISYWVADRKSLGLPIPSVVKSDYKRLSALVEALERLDKGESADKAIIPAYVTGSVSAAIVAVAYSGLLSAAGSEVVLQRTGWIGLAAACMWGAVVKGRLGSEVYKETFEDVARKAMVILEGVRSDLDGKVYEERLRVGLRTLDDAEVNVEEDQTLRKRQSRQEQRKQESIGSGRSRHEPLVA